MEKVTKLVGPGRDENDDPIPESEVPLWAAAVRPGSTEGNKDRGRDGKKIAYTVFFWPVPGQPLPTFSETDRLEVRGDECSIVVLDWRSPHTNRMGLEVLCSAGRG